MKKIFASEDAMWVEYHSDIDREDRMMLVVLMLVPVCLFTCAGVVGYASKLEMIYPWMIVAFLLSAIVMILAIVFFARIQMQNMREWSWLDEFELY